MKYLVVGASGFVGRHILSRVRSAGLQAVGTGSRDVRGGLVRFDLYQDRIADCVGEDFFRSGEEMCVVIAAVVTNMDQCLTDPERSRRINVENTIRLIDEVASFGARVAFLSSCFVFDGTIGYYTEEHAVSPANAYGRHKAEVEKHLLANHPASFIARLDKVVGGLPADDQLFGRWHRTLKSGAPIICIEGSVLSPTHVDDVAGAFLQATSSGLRGVHHVSNPEFFHRDELARQFCLAMNCPVRVETRPLQEFHFPDGRALKSYLDGSRFAMLTGMRFKSMRQAFAEFRQQVQEFQ